MRRILLAGDWKYSIYEDALSKGFVEAGIEVVPLKLMKIGFTGSRLINTIVNRIADSKSLRETVAKTNPDYIFLYRPESVNSSVLMHIKKAHPSIPIMIYHNDNPYKNRVRYLGYLRLIHKVHHVFLYRPSDALSVSRSSPVSTSVLMPNYITYEHYPEPVDEERYKSDVVYIGHWEDDGRDEYIDSLLDKGISVRVFGTRWKYSRVLPKKFTDLILPVYGNEYRRYLSSAKIALVFLSSANRDVYTRRCFEIPACSTFMLAPRTEALLSLFEEGHEAEYYDTKREMLNKVNKYLSDDTERNRVSTNSNIKVRKDMHNEIGRAKSVINTAEKLRERLCAES